MYTLFQCFSYIHYLWIGPFHLIVFTYLVYSQVGWSVFIVTAFVILQTPVQFGFARTFSYLRSVICRNAQMHYHSLLMELGVGVVIVTDEQVFYAITLTETRM